MNRIKQCMFSSTKPCGNFELVRVFESTIELQHIGGIMSGINHMDRSRRNIANSLIYRFFTSDELEGLTDTEFLILQKKLKPCVRKGYGNLVDFQEGLGAGGITGNNVDLGIYRRSMAAHHYYFDCFERYGKIFSLCYRLGVRHIYDIGCGQLMQGFLAVYAEDLTYTGIDSALFYDPIEEFKCEPELANKYFEKFIGSDRIKYCQSTYPCPLSVQKNNAGIMLGVYLNENEIPNFAIALDTDFERAIFWIPVQGEFRLKGISPKRIIYEDLDIWERPFEHLFNIWKQNMPNSIFINLGNGVVLSTKYEKDINEINKMYHLYKDRLYTEVMSKSWYRVIQE